MEGTSAVFFLCIEQYIPNMINKDNGNTVEQFDIAVYIKKIPF